MDKQVISDHYRIMRLRDVVQLTGLSRASIYRMIRAETFPGQFKLGSNSVGFLSTEVEQWLLDRMRSRIKK